MKIDILGVFFDNLTMEDAVAAGARLAHEPGFHYVVTPNPEIVNLARASREYGEILNGADLVLPDGIGVLHAGRILKTPLQERVPGIDFASGLLEELAKSGARLYLLGAKPGVAHMAGERLQQAYPGLVICGTGDGYFTDSEAVVQALRDAEAEVAFICLGAPKQERWMVEYGPRSGVRLMVGLGGALDVFSGQVTRAPKVWQRLGLEWLYRLICQPSRLGRIAKLPLFLASAWRVQRRRGSDGEG